MLWEAYLSPNYAKGANTFEVVKNAALQLLADINASYNPSSSWSIGYLNPAQGEIRIALPEAHSELCKGQDRVLGCDDVAGIACLLSLCASTSLPMAVGYSLAGGKTDEITGNPIHKLRRGVYHQRLTSFGAKEGDPGVKHHSHCAIKVQSNPVSLDLCFALATTASNSPMRHTVEEWQQAWTTSETRNRLACHDIKRRHYMTVTPTNVAVRTDKSTNILGAKLVNDFLALHWFVRPSAKAELGGPNQFHYESVVSSPFSMSQNDSEYYFRPTRKEIYVSESLRTVYLPDGLDRTIVARALD